MLHRMQYRTRYLLACDITYNIIYIYIITADFVEETIYVDVEGTVLQYRIRYRKYRI